MTFINNKKQVILIILAVLISLSIFALFNSSYFYSKYKKSDLNLQKFTREFESIKKENAGFKEKAEKLEKEIKAISTDRDNLITQAKSLLADRARVKELEAELGKLKEVKDSLDKESKQANSENRNLKEELKKLSLSYSQKVKDKKELEESLATERDQVSVTKLEKERLLLQKENEKLLFNFAKSEKQISSLNEAVLKAKDETRKVKGDLTENKTQLERLNKRYIDLVKKNKFLEQRTSSSPAKFTEIARQNKTLIKETANMHYNLGVFYTKNKEYPRAVTEFEKALALAPDDAYANFNLGYIYAEQLINRPKAISHFKRYLNLAKSTDKDTDWVRKYILTWETYEGNKPME